MNLSRRVTIRQLEVFVEAARQLNFSRVSETLHLSQPAVSMQIRQLEEAVGMPLFDKVGRGKALTEAGGSLLEHASRILGELQDAEQSLQSLRGLTGGLVTVGLVSSAKYFAPKLLAMFAQHHPGVEVRFIVGNRETLVQLLRENQTDLAIMGRAPGEVETVSEPLASNPNVLVGPVNHHLAGARRFDIQELRRDTFLQREEGSGTRIMLEELFRTHLFKPAKISTMGSNETIKQAVMAGLGVSLLSLHTLSLELRSREIAILNVDGLPLQRTWNVVHARRRTLSPAAAAFRRFLAEQTQAHLDAAFSRLLPARAHQRESARS